MRTGWLFIGILAGLHDGPSPAGLVVERDAYLKILDPVNRASEIRRKERVAIRGDRVRIEDLTFGTALIVRIDLKKAYRLDRSLKTYSEVTFEQISTARKGFLAELARLKERVKGTSDEQDIEKIERGFQSYPVTSSSITSTGRKEVLLGSEQAETQLLINGKIQIFKSFLDPNVAEGEAYFQALSAISAFGENIRPEIAKIKGFPLRGTLRYSLFLDRLEVEETVRSVRRETVSDELFDIPKDWKKVPLSGIESDSAPPAKIPESLRK